MSTRAEHREMIPRPIIRQAVFARPIYLASCVGFASLLQISPVLAQNVSVTVDASDCSPRILFDGTEATSVAGGSIETLSVLPGSFNPQLVPGGFPGSVTVDGSGNVSYAPELEGTVYTGAGTSTLGIVGHTITVSSIGLDNYAFVVALADPAQQDTIEYELPVGTYRIQATPGGVLSATLTGLAVDVDFNVGPTGTVSYDSLLDDVLAGFGTATVTLLGSPVTVTGPDLSGSVFFTGLSPTYPAKSITYTISVGNYRLQGTPGNVMTNVEPGALVSVDAAGVVSYDPALDGVVLGGLGTNTVEALPFTVHLDASGSSENLFILPLGPVLAGSQESFRLPVGSYTVHAASTTIGAFELNAEGECSATEFPFAGGAAQVRCPRPGDDFKCYKVKDLKDPAFEKTNVSLADQLSLNDGDFQVKKPLLLCNPTATNSGLIFATENHLACYGIKGPKLEPAQRPQVEATDRFGTLQLEIVKPSVLCVPSAKTILP